MNPPTLEPIEGKPDFGYKAPITSIHGWKIGGTHKAKYKTDEAAFKKTNREYLYIQCNCDLGYDHEASASSGNPILADVTDMAKNNSETNTGPSNPQSLSREAGGANG